jgi:hypothetical protein
MRDIRGDLQERAKILDEQIKSERDQFDGFVAQLKQEHGAKVERLKAELDAVKLVMGFEHRRLSNAAPAPLKDFVVPVALGVALERFANLAFLLSL